MNSEILSNVLVTCIEGGSNHWVSAIHAGPKIDLKKLDEPWYSDPKMFDVRGFSLLLRDTENNDHELSAKSFQTGWEKFARVYPDRAERVAENDGQADAQDTDVLLQIVTYGDVVYG